MIDDSTLKRLCVCLKECSDDLAAHIDYHYSRTLDYPSQKRRYDNDMQPVIEARKLLAEIGELKMTESVAIGKKTFRCDAGHEFKMDAWSTMAVQFDDPPQKHEFNYCPICFGQWAAKQWPLVGQ